MGKCLTKTAIDVIEEVLEVDAPQQVIATSINLDTINPDEVPDVPFKGEVIDMKIVKVYDGDTIHCIIPFGNVPVRLAIRMLGIDTPEIKRGKDRLEEERVAGLICRNYLRDLVANGAKVRIHKWDKFGGRVNGDVILPDGSSAVEVLIRNGYGRIYEGGKKEDWTHAQLTAPPYDSHPRNLNLEELEDY